MNANRGSTILFHTFFTLALHRVTVHHQAPTTLIPSTHHLGSCEHSRANLEAFKRGKNFYQTTIPYMFSPQQKSPQWLCHCCSCCTVVKPKSFSIPTADLPQPKKYSGLKRSNRLPQQNTYTKQVIRYWFTLRPFLQTISCLNYLHSTYIHKRRE